MSEMNDKSVNANDTKTNANDTKAEAKTEAKTPPGRTRVTDYVPATSKLNADDLRVIREIARDRTIPLGIRKELLGSFNVPDGYYAPDRGVGDIAVDVLQTALLTVAAVAAASAALVVIAQSARMLAAAVRGPALQTTPATTPLQLPPQPGASRLRFCGRHT